MGPNRDHLVHIRHCDAVLPEFHCALVMGEHFHALLRIFQLDDAMQRKEVLAHHERAVKFWQDRVAMANVD